MRRLFWLFALLGCGAPTPTEPIARTHLEDRGPAQPRVERSGTTGGAVAVTVRADDEAALAIAREVLGALVEGDRPTLDRLLEASLLRTTPTLTSLSRSRSAVLTIALNPSRRTAITPGLPLDRLVLLDELVTVPVESLPEDERVVGLDPSDVVVEVPLTPEGRNVFRAMLPGWTEGGRLVVRAREPRLILGI